VPRFEELSVKALWPDVSSDDQCSAYFPDRENSSKPIDRDYFFNVLNTLQPKYVASLIEASLNRRNDPVANEEKKEYILVSDDWHSKLLSHPFISSKKAFND
jgi:hypothetical protein